MDEVCLNSDRISISVSWRTESRKKDKKAFSKDSKVEWDPNFSSIYHLGEGPMRIIWISHRQMECSIMLLEEHHK
jgi:hypothetical protein